MSNTTNRENVNALRDLEMLDYRCRYGAFQYKGDIYIPFTTPSLYHGCYMARAVRYGDRPNDEGYVPLYKVFYKLPYNVDGFTFDFNKNIDSVIQSSIADVDDVTAVSEFDFYGL